MTILIIEDDHATAETMQFLLSHEGHSAVVAASLKDARYRIREVLPDAIVADVRLPDGDGLEIVKEYRDRVPCVVCTGETDEVTMKEIKTLGSECIFKPFTECDLKTALALACALFKCPTTKIS